MQKIERHNFGPIKACGKEGSFMQAAEMKLLEYKIGMTAEDIASASGVPLSTVQKIFSGVTKNPRKGTMEAIAETLLQEAKKRGDEELCSGAGREHCFDTARELYSDADGESCNSVIREPAAACNIRKTEVKDDRASGTDKADAGQEPLIGQVYDPEKRSGTYTIEDYYALPDERRVELIDGVFYNMAAPALIHQLILGGLHTLFQECVDAHEGSCEVYMAPCDVRLDRDDRTMVQPDLFIVCEECGIDAKRIEGAPDLTVEILSPSTRAKDMLLKSYKYAKAGVREYWIVDPEEMVVLTYHLEKDEYYPKRYSFQDDIPIGISGGGCSIAFSRVLKRIERHRR